MKQELHKIFLIYIEPFNEKISNIEQFPSKSKLVLKGHVDIDNFKQVQDKLLEFKTELKSAKDFLSQSRLPIKPELPYLIQMTSSVSKHPAGYGPPVTSPTKPVTSPTKPVTSPRRYPTTYSDAPCLVFGKKGDNRGQFNDPWAAAVDVESGDIHIADTGNRRICVHDKDARYKSEYKVGNAPLDLCFLPDGDIAVTSDYKIHIFDKNRALRKSFGKEDKGFGVFDKCGISVDKYGLFYVCDYSDQRVQVLDRSGSVVRVLGTHAPGKLKEPWSVAIHPHTGQVYVTDADKVYIYNHEGEYEASIGEDDIPGVRGFRPRYVSFRDDGLLCISDWYNDCIHLLRDGQIIQRIGKQGSAPGQFIYAIGTTFTNTGDLVVCDTGSHRLQIFSADTQ